MRDQFILVSIDVISNMISSKTLIPFHVNSKVNNPQSRLNIDSAIDEAWRDLFLVNLRSTQAKLGLITRQILHSAMKHIDNPPYDVNQALSWSSAHTVLTSISSPEFPLPSISTASKYLNRFRATSLPSIPASEHLLPVETPTLPSVATTAIYCLKRQQPWFRSMVQPSSIASKGNNIGSDQWFKAWFVWYPSHHRIKWENQFASKNTRHPGLMCTWTSLLSWRPWLMH